MNQIIRKQFSQLILAGAVTLSLFSCGGGTDIEVTDLLPVRSGDEYQYIDRAGDIKINPQFSKASVFRDGLALVQTSGDDPKWGFINEEGKYVVNAIYDEATVFSDGIAWVIEENAAPKAIDTEGEAKFTLSQAEKVMVFSEGLAAFSILDNDGEKWGFVNNAGEISINPQFKGIRRFKEDFCAVMNKEGKWGFIDKEGKIVINYQFDDADNFKNGTCVVSSGGKYGVIDKDGSYVFNPQYAKIMHDNDIYLINQNGKWGWADSENNLIINPQFSRALPFLDNDLAAVNSGDTWGYINREGKFEIKPQFNSALPFNGDLALVKSSDQIGMIDGNGKFVVNPMFDKVSDDLLQYQVKGESVYSDVTTDYFNIGAIISELGEIISYKGIDKNSSFGDVLDKFSMNSNDLNQYSKENALVENKEISKEASYSFYVLGRPFEGGGFSPEFVSDEKPSGIAYVISLKSRGSGKANDVLESLEKSIPSGYSKDDKSSNDEMIYKKENGAEIIMFAKNSNKLVVKANFPEISESEKEQSVEEQDGQDNSSNDQVMYKVSDPDGWSNLRATPGGDVVTKVYENQRFEVLGSKEGHKKVQLEDGTQGYIHESRVVKAK